MLLPSNREAIKPFKKKKKKTVGWEIRRRPR